MDISVAEIFESIDGEINHFHQGRQTVFLRLAGCNFNNQNGICVPCSYCDTKQYQDKNSGTQMSVEALIEKLKRFEDYKNLTITGGEPLWQKKALEEFLIKQKTFTNISIETNGSLEIPSWWEDCSFVIDVKISPAQHLAMNWKNYELATKADIFKFVVAPTNTIQTNTALHMYKVIRSRNSISTIAFSPIYSPDPLRFAADAKLLMNIIHKNEIRDIVLSLQIHKIIGMA